MSDNPQFKKCDTLHCNSEGKFYTKTTLGKERYYCARCLLLRTAKKRRLV